MNSAKWLIKPYNKEIQQTLKINAEIVNQQKLFLKKGKKYLKPMILKDVSKKINMHESTVSRVTSEKLMLTPRGIFEMKIFLVLQSAELMMVTASQQLLSENL